MANENIKIKDVELNWARLASPVKNQFGGENYELQIVGSADRMEEFAAVGKVKELEDGRISVNLKRKAMKADGTPMDPVRVVDANREPLANKGSIGNGSKGNVIVWKYDYTFAGNSGTAASLTAVQVTDHVVYEGSAAAVDFDVVDSKGEAQPF